MATILYSLTRDEVERGINYRLICETMCGAAWSTGRRRRRWRAEFTEAERKACSRLKAQAYGWYLRSGIPDEVTMTAGTLALWKKLEAFCGSI